MNNKKFDFGQYIRSSNEDKIITVGQTNEGKFVINIEQITDKGHKTITNIELLEEDFISIISASLLFTDHYKFDLTQKIRKSLDPNKITFITPALTSVEQQ